MFITTKTTSHVSKWTAFISKLLKRFFKKKKTLSAKNCQQGIVTYGHYVTARKKLRYSDVFQTQRNKKLGKDRFLWLLEFRYAGVYQFTNWIKFKFFFFFGNENILCDGTWMMILLNSNQLNINVKFIIFNTYLLLCFNLLLIDKCN